MDNYYTQFVKQALSVGFTDEQIDFMSDEEFLDSLIDKTVQTTEERIVGEIDKMIEKVLQMSDWKAHSVLEDLKSLITNKSDINNNKE